MLFFLCSGFLLCKNACLYLLYIDRVDACWWHVSPSLYINVNKIGINTKKLIFGQSNQTDQIIKRSNLFILMLEIRVVLEYREELLTWLFWQRSCRCLFLSLYYFILKMMAGSSCKHRECVFFRELTLQSRDYCRQFIEMISVHQRCFCSRALRCSP